MWCVRCGLFLLDLNKGCGSSEVVVGGSSEVCGCITRNSGDSLKFSLCGCISDYCMSDYCMSGLYAEEKKN